MMWHDDGVDALVNGTGIPMLLCRSFSYSSGSDGVARRVRSVGTWTPPPGPALDMTPKLISFPGYAIFFFCPALPVIICRLMPLVVGQTSDHIASRERERQTAVRE